MRPKVAEAGASVVLLDIDEDGLSIAAQDLRAEFGVSVESLAVDMADAVAVEEPSPRSLKRSERSTSG